MKYYRHKITGRIITQLEYETRISKWIKHYFIHIENADDDKPVKEEQTQDESLYKDLL